MSQTVRDDYVQYRTNPDNDTHSLSHFCSTFGYALDDVRKTLAGDANLEKDILDARRLRYAERMRKIDDALFKSAEAGDVRAADLLYRRFDNWNPKIVEETNNFYSFADIVKRATKGATPTRSMRKKNIPGVQPNGEF